MRLPEYDQQDALGLAALVARREVSTAELLEAALERCDARNPALGAVVLRWDASARARAAGPLPPGPLSGVPFLLKDLDAAWEGEPLEWSSRLLRGHRAAADGELSRRVRAAGLVPFGRTASSEYGILGTAEPEGRPPCRNPWDPTRTPGGSSGGSAAAVAARIAPAAHGGDGGGSIRIPASHCALFGLKPSRGRVSPSPDAESWFGLVQEHALTRSVRDSAALLDLLAGPAPGDAPSLPPPAAPFLAEVGRPPGRLRVAFTESALLAGEAHADCRAAVADAARLLASLGHEVEEAAPPLEREALVRTYLTLVSASVAADVARLARAAGRALDPALLGPETRMMILVGRHVTGADVAEALAAVQRARRAMAAFFERWDLALTATAARPPVRIGELAMPAAQRAASAALWRLPVGPALDLALATAARGPLSATPNTQLWNLTGQPAASVPLSWNDSGLPIGVQLAARWGEEGLLFRVASQLEQARPWAERAPPAMR